jgi:hypothetical protein
VVAWLVLSSKRCALDSVLADGKGAAPAVLSRYIDAQSPQGLDCYIGIRPEKIGEKRRKDGG